MTPALNTLIKRTKVVLFGYENFPEKNSYPLYFVKLSVQRTSYAIGLGPRIIRLQINRSKDKIEYYLLSKKNKDATEEWNKTINLLTEEDLTEYIIRIILTVEKKLLPEKPIGNGIGKFIFAS